MDHSSGCDDSDVSLEHEWIEPSSAFDHWMYFNERDWLANKEDTFQSCYDHVQSQ